MGTWWQQIGQTVREEFSDLPNAVQITRISVRLAIAAILGGVLGFDRQRKGKAAGLRTHMLVALGAALFVLIPDQAGISDDGISRVVQGLATGIGFLGAGTIVKGRDEEEVRGLTTAAGIWMTAAIGVAAGLGRESSAVLSTVLALLILAAAPVLERFINRRSR